MARTPTLMLMLTVLDVAPAQAPALWTTSPWSIKNRFGAKTVYTVVHALIGAHSMQFNQEHTQLTKADTITQRYKSPT